MGKCNAKLWNLLGVMMHIGSEGNSSNGLPGDEDMDSIVSEIKRLEIVVERLEKVTDALIASLDEARFPEAEPPRLMEAYDGGGPDSAVFYAEAAEPDSAVSYSEPIKPDWVDDPSVPPIVIKDKTKE